MNEDKIEKIIEDAKSVKLISQDKDSIRAFLLNHTNSIPFKPTKPVVSSFGLLHQFTHRSVYMIPFVVVLMFSLGAGTTSYLALNTLPGDTLYPVKLNFNENIEYMLAVSPEAKAEVDLKQVSTRLDEAEVLSITGNLTEVKSQTIQNNVSKKIISLNKNVEQARKRGNNEIVTKTDDDLDNEVVEHYGVFVSITNSASNSPAFSKLLNSEQKIKSKKIKTLSILNSAPILADENVSEMAMSASAPAKTFTIDTLAQVKIVTYNMKEVRKHKKADDCWTVVSKSIYDITPLIERFPGASSFLKSMCGVNSTRKFNKENSSFRITDQLEEYKIGEIDNTR